MSTAREGAGRLGPAGRLLALGALTLAYFLAGRLGLSLAFVHESATAVWPPTGIALAASLVWGYQVWPAVLLGAFLVNVTTTGSAATSLGIATGNTLEGLLGACLVNRFARGRNAFQRPRDIFMFAALAAILSTSVSASLGLATLSLAGRAAWDGAIWLTWWLGDAVGALVVAPVLVLWSLDRRWRWGLARVLELALLLGALALVSLFVFTRLFLAGNYALQVLCVPMLLWAAFRFGPREAATSVLALSVIATWGTLQGHGPFARASPNESLLLLQVFMGVWGVAALAVAAVVKERRDAEDRVRRLNQELEQRVRDRTEQLERSEARLVEAQQLAHIGSWEWQLDSNEVSWSEELYRIYGLEPGALAASYEGFLERVHAEDRARVDRSVRRALDERRPFAFEHRIVRPDGSVRTLSARGRLVLDDDGRPVRMVGTGQDISEQKRAEEEREQLIAAQAARREAEEANRLKDEFLATLSHELRTPLSAIVGWGHVLQQSALGSADARKAIAAVGRNAQALTRLIADLLDVSRAMSGRLALELRPTELRSVIQSALDTVRPEADAKSVRVELRIEADSSVAQADPERLGQVVWNLLSNAIKFNPTGGRVWVRVGRAAGGRLEIVVEDEGPGIAPEFLPHVFERFRQADPSTRRRHGGLGIGLAIVRNLVELHGGSVHAANRGEGRGAAFTVWLPEAGPAGAADSLVPAQAGRAAEDAGAWQASAASLQGVRVLVIEDERDGREAIVAMLACSGAEVASAASAAEGLSAVQAFRPHVVLSDIQMPEEDGYAFLRKLRALPPERGGRTPAAALTAYAGAEARATALRAGFQAHFAKPVSPSELVASIATLAATRRD